MGLELYCLLSSHPQGKGNDKGWKCGVRRYSKTKHGKHSDDCSKKNAPLVPDNRL